MADFADFATFFWDSVDVDEETPKGRVKGLSNASVADATSASVVSTPTRSASAAAGSSPRAAGTRRTCLKLRTETRAFPIATGRRSAS